MSTSNFCYKNRCVVVSSDDYEYGDTPKLGDWLNDCNKSYPSRELILDSDFQKPKEILKATKIVITRGYYDGSCIDFIQDEDKAYNTLREDYNIDSDRDDKMNFAMEKLLEKEAKIANRIINRIKRTYGYIEVRKLAQFSNGEAVYEKIGR